MADVGAIGLALEPLTRQISQRIRGARGRRETGKTRVARELCSGPHASCEQAGGRGTGVPRS